MTSNTYLRNDIQGLRAIAVLGVIFFHFDKHWLSGGFVGVDVFFVISGFLIAQIVLRKKELGNFSFVEFYIGRMRRIVPAYLVMLVVVSVVMAIFLIPRDFDTFKESLISAIYFNSNNYFAVLNDYFAPAGYELPLLHTWSLAVEMQFYLFLPLVIMVFPIRLLVPVLLLVVVFLVVGSEYFLRLDHRQAVYFSLSARVPEFLIGTLVAILSKDLKFSKKLSTVLAVIGVTLVGISFLGIAEGQRFPGLLALPACVGIALLLITPNSVPSRVLSCAPLVFVGALSYSLYLWHWPILAAIRYFSGTYEVGGTATLVFFTLTFGSAYLSYRFVEAPFRGRYSTKAAIARLVGLGAGTVVVITLADALNPKLVDPLPLNLTRYADGSEICHGMVVGDCIRGDKESSRILLMLGDSHAAQLNYFADIVGKSLGVKIKVITSSSCVTIPGFDVERISEGARQNCLNQISEGEKFTPNVDGLILAGMWQYQSTSDEFMNSLDAFLSDAAKRNQQVLVLAQVPMLSSSPQRIYRANSIGFHLSASLDLESVEANLRVKHLVLKHENSNFLDLSGNSFFADAPFQNHTLIYQDTHHLNEVGSQRYGEIAAPFFKSFMDKVYTSKATALHK
ncbi:MAG: acyltransferase family protein [Pseudomonas sp.]